jgi:CHAT domain-containing protein/tetratricopeptide (TPR) repeat protein
LIAAILCAGTLLAFVRPAGAAAPDLDAIRRLSRIGRFAEAELAARALLAKTERRTGPESVETADVLDELAVALRRGGKVGKPEAREVCERALRIKERALGTHDARYATSLYNLALLHFMRGEFDSAATHLDRSLRIREEALGPNHPDVAQSLLAVAALELERRDLASSRAAVERAVGIQRAALAPDDPERAYGLNVLGSLEYEIGALSNAIPVLEEAIALLERSSPPNRPLLGNCYHNLGCVYSEMADNERALKTFRKALRLREGSLGPDHPNVASTLVALGETMMEMADTIGAKTSYRRALRIEERAYDPDHPTIGWARMKLGRLYLATGDIAGASAMLRRALEIQERGIGADHPDLWLTLLGLAEVARAEGDLPAARAHYERTLRILEKAYGPSNIDVGGTLNQYARFLLDVQDSASALDVSLRAARVNEEQLRLISRGLAERQALVYASTLGSSLDVGLAVLASERYRGDPGTVGNVWNLLIRWRALVLDEVASRNQSVGTVEGLGEIARRLEAARQRLANLLVRGAGGLPLDRYRALTDATREEMEKAERDLGARSATFRSEQARGKVGWEEVVSALPSDAALVAFTRYGAPPDRSYLALVLAGDRRPMAVPLGPSKEIDGLVSRWTALVAAGPDDATGNARAAERSCRAAGVRLRVRVWDPLVPYLRDSKRVFIVPEGSIHLGNLAALPVGSSGYLVESGPLLHYLSAERDLARMATRESAGDGLLAMGGPFFDRQDGRRSATPPAAAGGEAVESSQAGRRNFRSAPPGCVEFRSARFEPLPESVKEVEEIAAAWASSGTALVLTGPDATERAFKELAPGRKVVHVATHGFFLNGRCGGSSRPEAKPTRGIGGISVGPRQAPAPSAEENPLRLSGIALAGANRRGSAGRDEEDGILTAEEIASLDLSRVQWAVLSACDTGAGEIQAGEGVLGLRRAFQVAGAATLIMSLWGVEDRSAREWMKALYEAKFGRNLETDEAVREATLGVLRERRAQARSTHPFYWAGFVAAGDWR